MYFENNSPLTADTSNGQLVVSLLQSLAESPSTGNLIFSPYSIITGMMMMMIGASGNTQMQLVKALFGNGTNFDGDYIDEQVQRFGQANRQLGQRNGKSLKTANRMYSHRNFALNQNYVNVLHNLLNAKAKRLDFQRRNQQALQFINSDVNRATEGMIPTLMTKIQKDTSLILINAVYFKAMWLHKFSVENTKDAEFRKSSGEMVSCPMMSKDEKLDYFFERKSGAKAVKLPYADSNIAMVLILPPESVSIKAFVQRHLNPETLQSILVNFRSVVVSLTIPRFRLSQTHQLIPILKNLGIHDSFNPRRARFNKISSSNGLFVYEVFQKAVIECQESGISAAAATVFNTRQLNLPTFEEFSVNRPFLFALVNEEYNNSPQFLFVGLIDDPTRE